MKLQQISLLQQREKLYSYSKLILPVGLGIEGRVKSWWRGGGGSGVDQGPAHQSGAACVLHTLLTGGGRGAALASHCVWGCPSPPPRARQTQLTLMGSEQDRTGWEEVRVSKRDTLLIPKRGGPCPSHFPGLGEDWRSPGSWRGMSKGTETWRGRGGGLA